MLREEAEYPSQSAAAYLRRVLKCSLMLALTTPLLFGIILHTLAILGIEHDEVGAAQTKRLSAAEEFYILLLNTQYSKQIYAEEPVRSWSFRRDVLLFGPSFWEPTSLFSSTLCVASFVVKRGSLTHSSFCVFKASRNLVVGLSNLHFQTAVRCCENRW